MRAYTVFLIKAILHAVFWILVCALFTAIIIGLVVVQYPTDPMSYVALSFILFVDGFIAFVLIAPYRKIKYKPKTVSKHLVFWLSAVLYCCLCGVAMLTNALFMALTPEGKIVVPLFICIFGGLGLADLCVLIYQIIAYIQIRQCLKYGEETTAEFVGAGKTMDAHYGRERHGTTITGVSVIFKFTDYDGKQTEFASRRVFSWDEVETLEKMGTFKIAYDYRTAVILETFEPKEKDEQQENSESQSDDEQSVTEENKSETASDNKGDE